MSQPGNVAALINPPPLAVTIRPMRADDRNYAISSWSEGYKLAPRIRDLTWVLYKQHVVPQLVAALDREDTQVLVADHAGAIAGWIAFVPGRRVATCHWIHTRFAIDRGEHLRRRKVMTQLISAAQLGSRFCYTHRGPKPQRGAGPPADEWIVRWLAGRGVTAAYVPMEEWKR